jgi:Xaa-Pro aminopeptidase
MIDLGLLAGSADEALEKESYRRYYMHRTSHWLGIDVHDVGRSRENGEPRPLREGMVLTVEPGLYVPADDAVAPAELRGQAVRIEDDVVVARDGPRLLTRKVPVEPDAVAALAGEGGTP